MRWGIMDGKQHGERLDPDCAGTNFVPTLTAAFPEWSHSAFQTETIQRDLFPDSRRTNTPAYMGRYGRYTHNGDFRTPRYWQTETNWDRSDFINRVKKETGAKDDDPRLLALNDATNSKHDVAAVRLPQPQRLRPDLPVLPEFRPVLPRPAAGLVLPRAGCQQRPAHARRPQDGSPRLERRPVDDAADADGGAFGGDARPARGRPRRASSAPGLPGRRHRRPSEPLEPGLFRLSAVPVVRASLRRAVLCGHAERGPGVAARTQPARPRPLRPARSRI